MRISKITGWIRPNENMTYEEVYTFYAKCDFIPDGKLLKYIE
jgi:hypothetical protein